MKIKKYKHLFIAVSFLLVALLSFFVLSPIAENPKTYAKTIELLEDKENTVYKLTISSAVISTAIAAIPSDATTGVADSITDLNMFFVICLTAILLEKYLITIAGFAAFKIIIPIGFIFLSAFQFFHNPDLIKWARKLIIFAIILVAIVPVSTYIGDKIVKDNTAINDIINTKEEDLTLWQKITGSVSGAINFAQEKLKDSVNSASVMLLSVCIIPILVLFLFVWITNLFFGTNLSLPKFPFRKQRLPKKETVDNTTNETDV